MALKIRFRQQGRTNSHSYRLVVTDVRAPRDGKYIESLGWYDPKIHANKPDADLNAERIQFWLEQGAQFTEKAKILVKRIAPAVYHAYNKKNLQKKVAKEKK